MSQKRTTNQIQHHSPTTPQSFGLKSTASYQDENTLCPPKFLPDHRVLQITKAVTEGTIVQYTAGSASQHKINVLHIVKPEQLVLYSHLHFCSFVQYTIYTNVTHDTCNDIICKIYNNQKIKLFI